MIDFIVTECDRIIADNGLPVDHRDYRGDTGRATKGAVLALKSRALLYAASPLHNPSGEPAKWEKAAKAAAAVIAMNKYNLPKVGSDPLYMGDNNLFNSPQLISNAATEPRQALLKHAMNRWAMKARREEIRRHKTWWMLLT